MPREKVEKRVKMFAQKILVADKILLLNSKTFEGLSERQKFES